MLKLFLHSLTGWYYTEGRSHLILRRLILNILQEHDLFPSGECQQQDGLVWPVKYIHLQDEGYRCHTYFYSTSASNYRCMFCFLKDWTLIWAWQYTVVDIYTYIRTHLFIVADYSSYNPGYFGKDRNLISKFEWILSHNAHEIQLDVFFRFTLWQRQSGARGSNDENISSPDLLFPFWKSVKEDRGARELICSIFVSCLNSQHQYFSLLESKDCMHSTRMFQFHSSLFIIALLFQFKRKCLQGYKCRSLITVPMMIVIFFRKVCIAYNIVKLLNIWMYLLIFMRLRLWIKHLTCGVWSRHIHQITVRLLLIFSTQQPASPDDHNSPDSPCQHPIYTEHKYQHILQTRHIQKYCIPNNSGQMMP